MGIFAPKYIVSKTNARSCKDFERTGPKAEMVWLASDEDREGEADCLAFGRVAGPGMKKTKRIVFHEITKSAILKAIENPRKIDYNLVNAQQARRVWTVWWGMNFHLCFGESKGGLRPGEVQSVAVRLIVEREREIEAFNPQASYRIDAEFITEDGNKFRPSFPKNFESKSRSKAIS